MRAAPTKPALGSTSGSRVVTTRPTRIQTTAAAPKKARLAVRSRASMTIESRGPDPSGVAHGRINRTMRSISDTVSSAGPVDPGRSVNDAPARPAVE